MKLAVITDTHYGYDNRTHKIHEKFLAKLSELCVKENVDAVVHCGDWIANNQHQLPRTWKMFRQALGELPILGVLGNHDRWDQEFWNNHPRKRRYAKPPAGMNLPSMEIQHKEWSIEHNIHLLEQNPFIFKDTIIYGFNGWYGNTNPPTNDAKNMASIYETAPTHVYMSHRAGKELEWILNELHHSPSDAKKVCVTHFPPYSENKEYEIFCANTSYLDFITEKFDLLLVGHSHRTQDWRSEKHPNCRIVNAGTHWDQFSGGYNKPNCVLVTV